MKSLLKITWVGVLIVVIAVVTAINLVEAKKEKTKDTREEEVQALQGDIENGVSPSFIMPRLMDLLHQVSRVWSCPECPTKKGCGASGGNCQKNTTTCNGSRVDVGCPGDDCTCCILYPSKRSDLCRSRRSCRRLNGTCEADCDACIDPNLIIYSACRGNCFCCVPPTPRIIPTLLPGSMSTSKPTTSFEFYISATPSYSSSSTTFSDPASSPSGSLVCGGRRRCLPPLSSPSSITGSGPLNTFSQSSSTTVPSFSSSSTTAPPPSSQSTRGPGPTESSISPPVPEPTTTTTTKTTTPEPTTTTTTKTTTPEPTTTTTTKKTTPEPTTTTTTKTTTPKPTTPTPNKATTIKQTRCVPGFFVLGDECFKVIEDEINWGKAEVKCKGLGSRHVFLAEPKDSAALAQYVYDNINKRDHHYWMGGRGDGSNIRWIKAGTIIPSSEPWEASQPSGKSSSLCLDLRIDFVTKPLGLTNPLAVHTCTAVNIHCYICESSERL